MMNKQNWEIQRESRRIYKEQIKGDMMEYDGIWEEERDKEENLNLLNQSLTSSITNKKKGDKLA